MLIAILRVYQIFETQSDQEVQPEMGRIDATVQLRPVCIKIALSETGSGGGVFYFGLLVLCSLIPTSCIWACVRRLGCHQPTTNNSMNLGRLLQSFGLIMSQYQVKQQVLVNRDPSMSFFDSSNDSWSVSGVTYPLFSAAPSLATSKWMYWNWNQVQIQYRAIQNQWQQIWQKISWQIKFWDFDREADLWMETKDFMMYVS